jgi:hypothetical protein
LQRFTTRILAAAVLAGALATSTAGQRTQRKPPIQKCELTIDHAPVVRGIRLGESYAEVIALFPRKFHPIDENKEDEFGVSSSALFPDVLEKPDSLQGVGEVHLKYIDRTVAAVSFSYQADSQWQSNLHLTAAIAQKLGLPVNGWTGKNPSFLDCTYFIVATAISRTDGPVLQVARADLDEMIAARERMLQEKKRETFKP